jgi:hypothetical protein
MRQMLVCLLIRSTALSALVIGNFRHSDPCRLVFQVVSLHPSLPPYRFNGPPDSSVRRPVICYTRVAARHPRVAAPWLVETAQGSSLGGIIAAMRTCVHRTGRRLALVTAWPAAHQARPGPRHWSARHKIPIRCRPARSGRCQSAPAGRPGRRAAGWCRNRPPAHRS